MHRPRRSTGKKAPNPALEKLKKIKDGEATHLELLETKDDDLFEEVDTREYLRRRQRENKFIEDDDGSGYVDHGQVEYNYSEEEEMEMPKGKKAGDKRKNHPKETDSRPGEQLLNYFQPGSKFSQPKKAKPMDSDALMGAIFSKIDSEIEQISGSKPALPFASPLPRKGAPVNRPAPAIPESPLTRLKATLGANPIPLKREPAEPLPLEDPKPPSPSVKAEPISQVDLDDFDMDMDHQDAPEEPKWKAQQTQLFAAPIETKTESEEISLGMAQEEDVRYLYWIDAYTQESNGHVYVMGKMFDPNKRSLVSCCVVVTNIQRNVYLLPNPLIAEPPETEDEEEMERYDAEREARANAIGAEFYPRWQKVYGKLDFNASLVTRSYAFDTPANIPKETSYVKLEYPVMGKECAFATGLRGQTFSHVFGSNTTPLELFLVKRKIMGPCWLRIEGTMPSASARSHCKLEFEVDSPKRITPATFKEIVDLKLKPPPLDIMSINIKTALNPKTNVNEIAIVNLIVYPNVDLDNDKGNRPSVRIAAIRQLPNTFVPDQVKENLRREGFECEVVQTEQALLNYILSRFAYFDPDVLVGHSFLEFTLAVLLARMDALQIATWARLGRLRRTKIPKSCLGSGQMAAFQQRNLINGRLLCDTYHGAKDTVKSKNYSLGQLCASHLELTREDIPIDAVASYYSREDTLTHLALHGSFDAYLQFALMLKLQLLPLSRQLTVLAGNLWNHTMLGARAKRNEFLLLHKFHKEKYICPDRQQHKGEDNSAEQDQPTRRKAAYLGGLVLEPKRGLYDSLILLLDFNSLYPSIIQEYNICFTTVDRDPANEDTLPEVPAKDLETGLLPKILAKLIEERSEVKKKLKRKDITASEAAELDIKQKALKLTANSMYGCLGYPMSRFYAKQLAMLITSKGREALQRTVELATSEGLEIVYGDTDSIMINTHTQEVAVAFDLAKNFKSKVNQSYEKLEIDIDGIFRRLLLLQKKKYAALLLQERQLPNRTKEYTTTVEAKGLDIVRREFCDLSHAMSEVVLKYILSGADKDAAVQSIYDYLTTISQQIRSGEIPSSRFIIYKSISKELTKYADAASQPHVQVALRLQKQQGIAIGKGSTIDYIICLTDDPSQPYAQRAFSPDEVDKDSNLQVDYDWYLSRQLLPPITRLCEPIDGITMSQLAESLGLDGSKYTAYQSPAHTETIFDNLVSQEERFQDITKLNITCVRCPGTVTIEQFAAVFDEKPQLALACPECQTPLASQYLLNKIQLDLRAQIHNFNLNWMECNEITCQRRTRSIASTTRACLRPGCEGTMQLKFSASQLYDLIAFYMHLFDERSIIASLTKKGISPATAQAFINGHQALRKPIAGMVEAHLKLNARRFVNLGRLFKPRNL